MRRSVRMPTLLELLIAGLAASCGGDESTKPKELSLNGAWAGSVQTATTVLPLSITLRQSGTSVTGNGAFGGAAQSLAVTVVGTVNGATFTLTLSAAGFNPITYTGTFTETSLAGTFNGSGFMGTPVTLHKQ